MVETISVKRYWDKFDDNTQELPEIVPSVVFKTRVRDESIGGDNPYRWEDKTTFDYFAGKRVVLFSLPGAFTPTCSTYQLPGFEEMQKVKKVKMIPDGSAKFTRKMKMDVQKDNLGFGARSWRYACVVNNGKIEKWFIEPGIEDNAAEDPYGETSPENILAWLKENG